MKELISRFVDMSVCINLDRRPDRWARFSGRMKELGFDVHRFPAVDGLALPPHVVPQFPALHVPMGAGAYASLLSHLGAIRMAKTMGLKGIWIWEDDAIVKEWMPRSVNSFLPWVPADWDMVYWGGKVMLDKAHVVGPVHRASYMYWTLSYMVRESCYDRCIEALETKAHWADQLLGGLHPQLKVYTMNPRPVQQNWTRDSDNKAQVRWVPPLVEESKAIEGWMTEEELMWIWDQARRSRRIIEIGAYQGRSTHVMCGATYGRVLTFDPWIDPITCPDPGRTLEAFKKNLAPHIRSETLTAIRRSTRDPHAMVQARKWLREEGADLVFIDADHTRPNVEEDIRMALELVAEGGVIAGHDYPSETCSWDVKWPDVKEAVDRLLPGRKMGPGSIWYWRKE